MDRQFYCLIALTAGLSAMTTGCTSPAVSRPAYPEKSWSDKIGDSIKSGTGKMTAAVAPKKPSADPDKTPKKPTPGMHVAMAQLAEQQGNFEKAEDQYERALTIAPDDLNALLGFAHLEDRQNNFEGAMKYYQRALKKHPSDPSVHNDLGLCYHRRGKLAEAGKELQKAVELKPQKKLYRDNLAAVLVDQGKHEEALAQLRFAHGAAVGHYNLGYLLAQKHDPLALSYFRKALEADPTLKSAEQWIAELSGPPAGGMPVAMANPGQQAIGPMGGPAPVIQPPQPPVQVASRPMTNYQAPAAQPPAASRPIRFPEVQRQSYQGGAVPPMPR